MSAPAALADLGVHDLPLFVLAGLLLNLTPGPDLAITTLRAATQGLRAGLLTAAGIAAGCLVHVALGALGLGALIAASGEAMQVVRGIGAAWLAWTGLTMIRRRSGTADADAPAAPAAGGRSASLFMQGALTNALNPKVALFFLAFVPQFIAPSTASFAVAFGLLGAVFVVNGFLVTAAFAWLAARLGPRLANGRAAAWLDRLLGVFFVALAARLAFQETT